MLKYVEGDLFGSPAQVIVNTVNTVGVMGKGLALDFKKRYPKMFDCYKRACNQHSLAIGKLLLYYESDHWLLLFPTKEHWRNPSRMEYLEKGLAAFVNKYADYNITSIAFPKLGCGNGELDWNEVRPLMEKYLKELPIDVYIYQGGGTTASDIKSKKDDVYEWENEKDVSFVGIKDEIRFHTLMMPIEFEYEKKNWYASWLDNGKLLLKHEDEMIEIDESDVHALWDHILASRIFANTGVREKDLLFALFASIGYMQRIMLEDERLKQMRPGYQLEMGKARKYWLKGQ